MKGPHMATITLKGEFTDLNTYIKADRTNRYLGGSLKKAETERVWAETRNCKGLINEVVHIRFDWYVKNTKKDPDNISFAKKFILDGLVLAGVLPNDTFKYICSFEDYFHVDKKEQKVQIRFFEGVPKYEN